MNVRLRILHCLKTERDVIHDGFPTDGFAPPPELKYTRCGMKTKLMHVASVPVHLILIHCDAKLNDQSSEDEPYVCDGSPPPSPKYAATTNEACRLKLSDGFLMWILTVASATDGFLPAATRDGFRMMRRLPAMTGGEKPVVMMNLCVKKNDGSHR